MSYAAFGETEQMSHAVRHTNQPNGCWHCPGSSFFLCCAFFPAHSDVHSGVGILALLLALLLAAGCWQGGSCLDL